jgi:hypothetical protein
MGDKLRVIKSTEGNYGPDGGKLMYVKNRTTKERGLVSTLMMAEEGTLECES